MPSEVNAFYAEGKTRYLADMDVVIGQVADVVGGGLNAARARIAQGKAEIAKYVAQLPQDLQQVGKEAEEKLAGQFEQLDRRRRRQAVARWSTRSRASTSSRATRSTPASTR